MHLILEQDVLWTVHEVCLQGIAVETPAATFIADMVRAHPGEISILALGPLTNIALAMQLDAQLAPQLVRASSLSVAFVRMHCWHLVLRENANMQALQRSGASASMTSDATIR